MANANDNGNNNNNNNNNIPENCDKLLFAEDVVYFIMCENLFADFRLTVPFEYRQFVIESFTNNIRDAALDIYRRILTFRCVHRREPSIPSEEKFRNYAKRLRKKFFKKGLDFKLFLWYCVLLGMAADRLKSVTGHQAAGNLAVREILRALGNCDMYAGGWSTLDYVAGELASGTNYAEDRTPEGGSFLGIDDDDDDDREVWVTESEPSDDYNDFEEDDDCEVQGLLNIERIPNPTVNRSDVEEEKSVESEMNPSESKRDSEFDNRATSSMSQKCHRPKEGISSTDKGTEKQLGEQASDVYLFRDDDDDDDSCPSTSYNRIDLGMSNLQSGRNVKPMATYKRNYDQASGELQGIAVPSTSKWKGPGVYYTSSDSRNLDEKAPTQSIAEPSYGEYKESPNEEAASKRAKKNSAMFTSPNASGRPSASSSDNTSLDRKPTTKSDESPESPSGEKSDKPAYKE